ncbi:MULTISPECIES: Ig-like domain repeat protein [unclassified Streptomyces]|uniref:Ig-like domain repeat protein n=1 Tax=unclassified Streptomyces TaxID=2593676 RepID=UPI002365E2A4|nr:MULTISPECIES: Ig-like domain repeat protein [unclassified Streptomyces]MDF3146108.1 Ig-like domain repeat protein [Streptomyces sp. T21Q-yed]WDF39744.1 Ig-like domain repeat protein [Streptomyces sp. T12]
MRRRTLPAATALAVLFSSVALVATGTGSAAADSSTSLPLKSTGDIVVDGVHQRVFISDPTAGQVVVTDYAGALVGTVGSLPGVRGLELSPDSGTVYAAVGDADAIVAIDTATATEAHRYSTGTADPQYLAETGGKIWFGYGGAAEGNIGSLDLSGTDPAVTLNQAPTNAWYSAPILDASAGAPGTLVAGALGQSPVVLAVYDVSSGTPSQTAYAFDPGSTGGGNLMDMAVTPDGKDVVTASGAPYYQAVYKLTDLSKDGKYVTNPYPNAVDIAPNGDVAAGTSSTDEADVHLFKPGTSLPLKEYTFGSDQLAARGLAWAPDGSKLFAVSSSNTLYVYDDPTKVSSTLTASAPATATRAQPLTVTGTLTSSAAFPAGTTVAVTRTDDESPSGKSLGTATVAADGSYSFTDTPPAGGKVTYTVTYAGDADHAGATASGSVTVAKTATTVTLNNNLKVYGYGSDVTFTAHLGTTYKNRTVEIWADPYGSDKPNALVKKGTVDSSGNLTATVRLTRDTKVSAKFTGDTRYAAKTTTNTVYSKVAISTSLTGAYKTATAWNAKYYYFHQSKDPVFNTTMTMYPGRKYQFQIQQFYSGAWHTNTTQYFGLDRYGKDSVLLDDTPPTGVRFRIRSSYIDTTSGDNVNTTTYGSWKYFTFTR